jgi:hypothetical protein
MFPVMKQSIGALFVLALTAGALAACNGGGGNVSAPPGTGTWCGSPPYNMQVLYPIPGTKNAPINLGTIYVSTDHALPPSNLFNFYLLQSNNSSTFTSTFFGVSPSSIPSPHAKPSYPSPVYYGTSLPASYLIGSDQSVSLFWNDGGTGCSPHSVVSSFSTGGS